MKSTLRLALNLALLCLALGLVLGWVNAMTKPLIEIQDRQARERAMKAVMKKAVTFEAVGRSDDLYQAYDANRVLVGYIVRTKAPGYSSVIEISYGVNRNNQVTGVQILSQNETAGLGTKVATPWFFGQFQGKKVDDLEVKRFAERGLHHIAGITGATISSEAVTRGVRESLAEFIKMRREEK